MNFLTVTCLCCHFLLSFIHPIRSYNRRAGKWDRRVARSWDRQGLLRLEIRLDQGLLWLAQPLQKFLLSAHADAQVPKRKWNR